MQSAKNFIFLTVLINFLKRKATIIIKVWHNSIAGVLGGTVIKIAQPLERIATYPSSNLHQKPQIYISKHCLARADARSSTVREEK
jgi:hypothetical protein